MTDTNPYVTALADLRARRDQLDCAITALEVVVRNWPTPKKDKSFEEKKKDKPFGDMTDVELLGELDRLETAQSEATGWGAAVGVRDGYIKEIKREQERRMRRVPRFEGPKVPGLQEVANVEVASMAVVRPPRVADKTGRDLKVGDPCTWRTTDRSMDVVIIELRHHNIAQVSNGGEHRALATGEELRYDETGRGRRQPYTLGHEEDIIGVTKEPQ